MLHFPRSWSQWLPSVIVLLIAATTIRICQVQNEQPLYEPLEVLNLRLEPDHVVEGSQVTLIDGICNNSDETITVAATLGAQEEGDPLVTRNVVVLMRSFPMEQGCFGKDAPLSGPLSPMITAGRWHLYLQILVMGPQSGQIQRLSRVSNTFVVVAP